MPLERFANITITWPAGGVVAGNNGILASDPFNIDQTAINVQAHMDASGTGGDVEFYVLQSPDGVSYDGSRPEHAVLLGVVDLDKGPGEQITRKLPIPQNTCQLLAINRSANAATVTASRTEQRAS